MSANAPPLAASVEDYDSDTNQAVKGSRQVASTTVKRSSSSSKPPSTTASPDVGSDSGYSSRTAATVDSAQSPTKKLFPEAHHLDVSATTKGGATAPEDDGTKNDNRIATAPKLLSSRPPSSAQIRHSDPRRRCSDSACKKCLMGFSPTTSPLDSPWNSSIPPPPPPQYPHTPQNYSPYPSPMAPGQPPPPSVFYPHAVPTLAPPQPRRRPPAMQQPRPSSFHATMGAPPGYWTTPAHNYPQYEHRGHHTYPNTAIPTPPFAYPEGQYTNMSYFRPQSPHPQPMPAAISHPVRPPLPHANSDRPPPRGRPMSTYGALVVSYDGSITDPNMMIRQPSLHRPSSRQQNIMEHRQDYYDRQRMPPPPLPLPPAPKPSSRNPHKKYSRSNSATVHTNSESDSASSSGCSTCSDSPHSNPIKRQPTRPSVTPTNPTSHSTRRSSTSSSQQHQQSRGRRNSYMGHELPQDTERRTLAAAEAYQETVSGRRGSATSRKPSPARQPLALPPQEPPREQSKSRTRSRDAGGGIPRSKSSSGDAFKICVDAREGFNVQFSGAMEGRMISMTPREHGMAELTIGSANAMKGESRGARAGSVRPGGKGARGPYKAVEDVVPAIGRRRPSKGEGKKADADADADAGV